MTRLSFFLIIILTLTLALFATNATAAPTKFKNCKALNKHYPGGVARPGAVNKGGETKYRPTYSLKLYKLNKGKDRDKDGIACER